MGLSPDQIAARLEDAALTLRLLPDPAGLGPRGYGNSWPEVVQEARHAYGCHRARSRIVPSIEDIARMDEPIGWLSLIEGAEARHLVCARASGRRWSSVARRFGVSRGTAWRRWSAAILTIANCLNEKEKRRACAAAAKIKAGEGHAATGSGGVQGG